MPDWYGGRDYSVPGSGDDSAHLMVISKGVLYCAEAGHVSQDKTCLKNIPLAERGRKTSTE